MRLSPRAFSGILLISATVLAGCGGSGSSTKLANITFKSAAIDGSSIPARYTCDGANTPPPLEWGEVPAGTGTLVLMLVGVQLKAATHSYKLSVEWTVAGLNPALHRIVAGRLPAGAFVGEGTDGKRRYSVCPKNGQLEQYQFELYALPATDVVSRRFAGLPVLAALAGKSTPAIGHGDFIALYKRTGHAQRR
jgi:phosphatidylethanolamine-binding protein (PEBP) family uncharacterized protein